MRRGTLMKLQGPASPPFPAASPPPPPPPPPPFTPLSYVNVQISVSTLLDETKTALPSAHVKEPTKMGKDNSIVSWQNHNSIHKRQNKNKTNQNKQTKVVMKFYKGRYLTAMGGQTEIYEIKRERKKYGTTTQNIYI